MKRLFKTTILIICFLMVATFVAACGEKDSRNEDDKYTFEAEYINLDGKGGSDYSGSSSGTDMIKEYEDASNGFYVGSTHCVIELEFEFESDSAKSAEIILGLASELGNLALTPDKFGVLVNDIAIEYGTINLKGGDTGDALAFYDKTFTTSVDLKEGKNVLKIAVYENQYKGGDIGGPFIDYVKINTEATLEFNKNTDNLNSFIEE